MRTLQTLFLVLSTQMVFSQNPKADFQVNIDYKCGFATTEFINNSVNADTFLWDVNGSGNYTITNKPRGSNIETNKKWIVTLIAKQNGLSDTLSKEVEIFNTHVKFDTTIIDACQYAPLTVEFTNMSEVREGDTITYQWDFGDETQSDEDNPEHIYDLPKTYFVTLTGTKSDGCTLSYSDYIIVKDTAQKGEFEFAIAKCNSESETSPCGYDKTYMFLNDSIVIHGYFSGNCGTQKTATLRYCGDTVKIKTWEVGPLTTCSCGYCFEITIPNNAQDSAIVAFNGVNIAFELTDDIRQNLESPSIKIFPNPVNDYLTIDIEEIGLVCFEFKIVNSEGQTIKTGIINQGTQLDLNDLRSGLYMLIVLNRDENKEYIAKFIKE